MSALFRNVITLLLLCPCPGAAQVSDSLLRGESVRVVARCERSRGHGSDCREGTRLWTYTGRLEAVDRDNLRIREKSNGVEVLIPTASIDRLLVADGTRGHFWKGAGFGLLGGALIGGVIGSGQSLQGSFFFQEGQGALVGVGVGGTAGLLLGGVVGALIRTDRWRAVHVPEGRLRVAPRMDALGVTVAVKF